MLLSILRRFSAGDPPPPSFDDLARDQRQSLGGSSSPADLARARALSRVLFNGEARYAVAHFEFGRRYTDESEVAGISLKWHYKGSYRTSDVQWRQRDRTKVEGPSHTWSVVYELPRDAALLASAESLQVQNGHCTLMTGLELYGESVRLQSGAPARDGDRVETNNPGVLALRRLRG